MRYRCDIGGEPRCEGAGIRKLVVLTRRKRRVDLFRRFFPDVRENIILAKGVAELCDDITPDVAVDAGGRSVGCRTGKQANEDQDQTPRHQPP